MTEKEIFENAIASAYEAEEKIVMNEDAYIKSDGASGANISSIVSLLVQEAGRYAERFASDVVISINSMNEALEDAFGCDGRLFVFGIRRDGVDHLEFVASKMKSSYGNSGYFEEYYRKIYAVRTSIRGDEGMRKLYIEMKEIRLALGQALWKLKAQEMKARSGIPDARGAENQEIGSIRERT